MSEESNTISQFFSCMGFIIQKLIFQKHLEDSEEIFFVAHKHWVAVMKPVLRVLVFGFAVPWVLYMLFTVKVMFFIACVWSAFAFVRLIYDLVDWYADAWLITSQGIIDLEWKGIFDQTSSRIEYPSIEGVSYEIKGVWATVLNYGVTQLDKVSNSNPIVLPMAARPKNIELKVLQYKTQFEEINARTDSAHLKDLLVNMLQRHIKEHGWDATGLENPEEIITIEDLDKAKLKV